MLDTRFKRWYDILGILENKHANSVVSHSIDSVASIRCFRFLPGRVAVVMVGAA